MKKLLLSVKQTRLDQGNLQNGGNQIFSPKFSPDQEYFHSKTIRMPLLKNIPKHDKFLHFLPEPK